MIGGGQLLAVLKERVMLVDGQVVKNSGEQVPIKPVRVQEGPERRLEEEVRLLRVRTALDRHLPEPGQLLRGRPTILFRKSPLRHGAPMLDAFLPVPQDRVGVLPIIPGSTS